MSADSSFAGNTAPASHRSFSQGGGVPSVRFDFILEKPLHPCGMIG
jgi:hypothetical protein